MQKYDERYEIATKREYKVVKSNDLIQKARYELSTQELKLMNYLFSLLKPNQTSKSVVFMISDFCKVTGIQATNGGNYMHIRKILKALRDKSFYLSVDDGQGEVTVGWLAKVELRKNSGVCRVTFEDELFQYVQGLVKNFTAMELINTLALRSAYSIRIYEFLRSYSALGRITVDVNGFKHSLGADHYSNFKDFRVKAIEKAISEINEFTDIFVSYEAIKRGRRVDKLVFYIKQRSGMDKAVAQNKAARYIDGQIEMSDLYDMNTVEPPTVITQTESWVTL